MPRTSQPTKTSQSLKSRPTDIFRPPAKVKQNHLPPLIGGVDDNWRVATDEANEWPYPEPDTLLAKPEPSLELAVPADAPLHEMVEYSEYEPWGRMGSESDTEYKYFLHYRAQGFGREIHAVAKYFNLSRNTIGILARNKDWHERVVAWDITRERVYTQTLLLGVREMAEKHVKTAAKGIKGLSAVFEEMERRQEENPTKFKRDLGRMPIKNLIILAQRSAQVLPNLMAAERLARNLPTEIIDVHHEHDINVQTNAELTNILIGLAGSLPEVIDGTVIEDEPGADGADTEGADPEAQ